MLLIVVAKLIALAFCFIWMKVLFPAVYFKQMVLQMVQTSIWNVEGGGHKRRAFGDHDVAV
jgi:hypothetical protein